MLLSKSEFNNIYYGVSVNGYILLANNDYDYNNDFMVIDLIKKYKKVSISDKFTKCIDFLPDGITHLEIGKLYNDSLINLPKSVKHLVLQPNEITYSIFNQSLDYLPIGLETLKIRLNSSFNKPIDNLPCGLKELYFVSSTYNLPINNLPESLESLTIGTFDYANTHTLPQNLNFMTIQYKITIDNLIFVNKLIHKYQKIKFTIP